MLKGMAKLMEDSLNLVIMASINIKIFVLESMHSVSNTVVVTCHCPYSEINEISKFQKITGKQESVSYKLKKFECIRMSLFSLVYYVQKLKCVKVQL